ncbi:hypothetical protein EON63_14560 [archaeon]|nr:MAG: hypothetical protein EON63_14560 [archaeon]
MSCICVYGFYFTYLQICSTLCALLQGDMMYNPPFWLHAVGTVPGLTISVANRVFRKVHHSSYPIHH